MSDTIVEIRHLSKAFTPKGPFALDNIEAALTQGQIIGLVGPDGAGKTTLMRLMAGLLHPTKGSISVLGKDTIEQGDLLHHLTGYMPQKFGLYEDLSVQQNLNLYAALRGVRGAEKEEIFAKLLSFTNLASFTDRLAGALSGGMKQKLGLACALMKKPSILFLDEPSVGVDPISRRELWKMIQALVEEGITVVWSTSYLDEAEYCDTVLLLNGGKLLFCGPPRELTQTVQDRVFAITDIVGNRRALLFEILRQPDVSDGVIQGKNLRIVTKSHATLSAGGQGKVEPIAPRFEDAFIDVLGGGPGSRSLLAEKRPAIAPTQEAMVVAKGLTKRFGDFTAVSDVSFAVQQKEIFGLLGPNGAGKSTTFKMLCGLLPVTAGSILIDGVDFQKAPGENRAQIGYMAQKFSLYRSLSVLQNLRFFAGIYNLQGKEREQAIEQMVEIFDLKKYLDESAEALPLGYKQRLALACANMHHPKILFLDEPTSGVDPITRREFWNHINGLVEKGVTILITTHFLDEAEYCDRIALIYRGELIHIASPDALKELVKTEQRPNPSLEDAFVELIEEYDARHPQQ